MPKNPDNLDTELPISLKHLRNVIENTIIRYPYIPKYQVVLIIRAFWKCLRFLLISGEIISLSGIFTKLHLLQFKRGNNNVIQAKLSTPGRFKSSRD